MEFERNKLKSVKTSKKMLIYYPYYTVIKSGIIDINRNRIVIEGTNGDIQNMVLHNIVDVTMIFTEEDVEIKGDERFFEHNEVLTLIDYGKGIRKMSTKDLDLGKIFSFILVTCVKQILNYKQQKNKKCHHSLQSLHIWWFFFD